MFADDTSVFIKGQSYENVCQLLNEELKKCDIWIKANKLTLKLEKKTHFTIFHRSRIKSEGVQITIRNENFKETTSTNFLEIIVDNKLSWHEHIIYIKNKVSQTISYKYHRLYIQENMLLSKLSNKCITHLYFHISCIVVKFEETLVTHT